jgi:hypothetical protein
MAQVVEHLSSKNKKTLRADMVVHTFNPHTQEAETGGLPVEGQAELHSKTLSQEQKKI